MPLQLAHSRLRTDATTQRDAEQHSRARRSAGQVITCQSCARLGEKASSPDWRRRVREPLPVAGRTSSPTLPFADLDVLRSTPGYRTTRRVFASRSRPVVSRPDSRVNGCSCRRVCSRTMPVKWCRRRALLAPYESHHHRAWSEAHRADVFGISPEASFDRSRRNVTIMIMAVSAALAAAGPKHLTYYQRRRQVTTASVLKYAQQKKRFEQWRHAAKAVVRPKVGQSSIGCRLFHYRVTAKEWTSRVTRTPHRSPRAAPRQTSRESSTPRASSDGTSRRDAGHFTAADLHGEPIAGFLLMPIKR